MLGSTTCWGLVGVPTAEEGRSRMSWPDVQSKPWVTPQGPQVPICPQSGSTWSSQEPLQGGPRLHDSLQD